MKIRPIGDRVVLKQFEAEEKTKSGIILPNKSKEKPPIYEVTEVGDGVQNDGSEIKMFVKVGDKVVCNKYSGLSVIVEEEEYVIIRQSELLAIVEE